MASQARAVRPSRLVSVRLTAWYCGLFSLSLAVLFGFVYWTLDATLRKGNADAFAPRASRHHAPPHSAATATSASHSGSPRGIQASIQR